MSTTHRRAKLRQYRFPALASLAGLVLALALAVGAAASGSGTGGNRLFAYVVPASAGPLHVGESVYNYIYVANWNRPTNMGRSRMTLPNAFVVDNINQKVFVDGAEISRRDVHAATERHTLATWAGRWVSTVTCDPGTPPPCTVVGKPAVIPGENTAVANPGWVHGPASRTARTSSGTPCTDVQWESPPT